MNHSMKSQIANKHKKNFSFTTSKYLFLWIASVILLLGVVGCYSYPDPNVKATSSGLTSELPLRQSYIKVNAIDKDTRVVESVTGDTFFIHAPFLLLQHNLIFANLEFRTGIPNASFSVNPRNIGLFPNVSEFTEKLPQTLKAAKNISVPFWAKMFNLSYRANFVRLVSPSKTKIYTLVGVVDCKVSFDTDKGSPLADIVVERSSILPPTILPEPQAPTKDGHTFEGWYTDQARTKKFYFKFNPIIANIKLYAKWNVLNDISSDFKRWLDLPRSIRSPLNEQSFAYANISSKLAKEVTQLLYDDKQKETLEKYEDQWNNRLLQFQGYNMPLYYRKFGNAPMGEWSLIISMHGGGGVPQQDNDDAWETQKYLYDGVIEKLPGGVIYVAPRAPINAWNMWFISQVDDFLNIIIQVAVAHGVNPNKIYLHGVSAGGDAVYQVAPRMADRFAAAAMLMGHPNDASPQSLMNLPFSIHVGENDYGFGRNEAAKRWGKNLDVLSAEEPGAYIHDVQLYPNTGHGLAGQDVGVFAWLENYTRKPLPNKVVWRQSASYKQRESFYWLQMSPVDIKPSHVVIANYSGQVVNISETYANMTYILLNDKMMNLDLPVTVKYQGKEVFTQKPTRTILNIYNSLQNKGDKELSFPAVLKFVKP